MPRTQVALFGPQVTQWTPQALADLQSALVQDPKLQFLAEALVRLPSLWPLIKGISGGDEFPSEQKLEALAKFAQGGEVLAPQNLTNTQLAPLTIVSQTLDLLNRFGHSTFLRFAESAQGFCIGFLSAAVFASSTSWEAFKVSISNALRLAVCVGVAVDAEDASRTHEDRAIALGVRLNTYSDRASLDSWLDRLSDVSGERDGEQCENLVLTGIRLMFRACAMKTYSQSQYGKVTRHGYAPGSRKPT